jgi:hypothetical protein
MGDKVISLRSLLRLIALVVLALIGPLDGVQAAMAPSAQACQCGCAWSPEEPCPCHAPAQPQTAGKLAAPCHAAPGACNPTTAGVRKTTADLTLRADPTPVRRSEPRPWLGQTPRPAQALASVATTLRRWTGQQNPPPNLDRLAQLKRFRV